MLNLNPIELKFSKDGKKYTAMYTAFINGKGDYKYHHLTEVREETPNSTKEYRLITMSIAMSKTFNFEALVLGFEQITSPMVVLEEINIVIPHIILSEYTVVREYKGE